MLINRRTVTVEWGDCDAAGIVYFPRYFAWFDASTAALFRRAGLEKHDLIKTFGIVGYPVVDTRARFIRSSTFGDIVDIETTDQPLGPEQLRRPAPAASRGETGGGRVRDAGLGRPRTGRAVRHQEPGHSGGGYPAVLGLMIAL